MLLERDPAMQTILDLIRQGRDNSGNIILVSGDAGVGKSSLLLAVSEQLGSHIDIGWGYCDALSTPRTLGPLKDIETTLNINFEIDRHETLPGLFSHVFNRISSRKPVLIFEDLHWADYATLDLIKFLGRRVRFLPVPLILSFRETDLGQDHDLRSVIAELPPDSTTSINLEPLSPTAVSSMAEAAGKTIPDLYELTKGNPLFVHELVNNWSGNLRNLPTSIQNMVSAKLQYLDTEIRSFLETLSLFPSSLPLASLMAISGHQCESWISECQSRKILQLTANNRVKFFHELTRTAINANLSPIKKIELCKGLLQKIDQSHMHFDADIIIEIAAGAYDAKRILDLAPEAAKAAADFGAHKDAAAYLEKAKKFLGEAPPEQAAQIYENWAYEAALSQYIDENVMAAQRQAISLWRALDRPEKVGENLRTLSRMHWYRGEAADADRLADEAIKTLEQVPPSAVRAMAYSLRAQLHMLNSEMEGAKNWGLKAIAMAEDFGNIKTTIHALNTLAVAQLFTDEEDGLENMQESLQLALKHGFHEQAARAYTNLSEHALETRQFELAEKICAEGIAFDTRYDLDSWTFYLTGLQAQLRMEQGRYEDARRICEGILELPNQTLLMKQPALTTLSLVKIRTGDKGAYEMLNEATEKSGAIGEVQYELPILCGHIEAAIFRQDPDSSKATLRRAFEINPAQMHVWSKGHFWVWAKRLGVSVPKTFEDKLAQPHKLELSGNVKAATALWEEKALPFEAGMTLLYGVKDDISLLLHGYALFEKIGAKPALKLIAEKITRLGHAAELPKKRRGPYGASKNHPANLTLKEQAILKYLVEGLSNKQIALTLKRSPRTIESHVSSLLSKLNVSTRMEAVLMVQNQPWLK